jgi:hypothetical protein
VGLYLVPLEQQRGFHIKGPIESIGKCQSRHSSFMQVWYLVVLQNAPDKSALMIF